MAVTGGPEFRLTYANGDQTAYVTVVYDAIITDGEPIPDLDETSEVRWFAVEELAAADLGAFAHATFRALGLV